MARRGIFRQRGAEHAKEFKSNASQILRKATIIGAILGLIASFSISLTGGNAINMNGTMVTGFSASIILVIACAIAGFVIGLIGWLLMRALGEAAKSK